MNIAKQGISSAIRSTFNHKPTSETTLTLPILETQLQKCQNLKQFTQILSQMIFTGFIRDTYASSRLLKSSTDLPFIHIDYSRKIFDRIENASSFTWNTMMRGYLKRSYPNKAMFAYQLMVLNYVSPDKYTYAVLLQASAVRFAEWEGKELHDHVIKLGFDSDLFVQNTMINMYRVCDNVGDARKMFDAMPVLDSVSWNSMLAGYVQRGNLEEARAIYDRMPERNTIVSNSMIALLGRSGRVSEALQVFNAMDEKDLVSWTALISCYEQNEMYEAALLLFLQLNSDVGMVDEVVVVSVLSACTHLSAIRTGEMIHGLALKTGISCYINLQNALIHMYSTCGDIMAAEQLFKVGYQLDLISWNSMISGYSKCGLVENARALFNSMPERDIVSWSAMIAGYAQQDQFSETLALFQQMQLEEIRPDETTLVSVLSACTHLAAFDQGRWVHAYLRKCNININPILGSTLIDMYMKFGCVESALEVFLGMEEMGLSAWNALIHGLAMNGLVERSLEMFSEMEKCGAMPNETTFVAVLGACRHMGLVDEGRHHFESMTKKHKIEPTVKHYGCMVDLFGRAGLLKEAENLIESMPMPPSTAIWGALLGACKKHGDSETGERIGRRLIELQPNHDGFHVLLSNIYASKGDWNDVLEVREKMKKQNVIKTPGCSMIEVNGAVHEFLASDKMHPQINEIEEMLDKVAERLKMFGYAPDPNEVSPDIDEE